MYIYATKSTCIFKKIANPMYVCLYVCMYVHVNEQAFAVSHLPSYICVYLCMYVYMYCTCMYINIFTINFYLLNRIFTFVATECLPQARSMFLSVRQCWSITNVYMYAYTRVDMCVVRNKIL